MSMLCPKDGTKAACIDTRRGPESSTRRRYKCLRCGARWTTGEFVMVSPGKSARRPGAQGVVKTYQAKLMKEAKAELRQQLRDFLGFRK